MSKAEFKQASRKAARSKDAGYEDQVPGKMLGKLAKMRYGAGPSRIRPGDVQKMIREEKELLA